MSRDRATPADLRRLLHQPPVTVGRPVRGRVLLHGHSVLRRYVDGAWWPRTRHLPRELPTVIPSIGTRLTILARITYSTSDWSPVDPDVDIMGGPVDLDPRSPAGVITFAGPNATITFGLIAPEASQEQAERLTASILYHRSPAGPPME